MARVTARAPSPVVRAATLAAAVAVGALVGFGVRSGASLGRLGVVALRMRGLPEFVAPDHGVSGLVLLGGAQVALFGALWGVAGAALATRVVGGGRAAARERAAGLTFATIAVTVLAIAAIDAVLPDGLRLAAGTLLAAERIVVALLVAVAAWLGVRLADRGAAGSAADDATHTEPLTR